MSQNFLEIQDVTFAASKKNKVNNVTFKLETEGEIICLLGPSGIGKTTMLRTIAGLEKIETGKIILKGKTISSSDFHMEPEKRNIALSFKKTVYFPIIMLLIILNLELTETKIKNLIIQCMILLIYYIWKRFNKSIHMKLAQEKLREFLWHVL